MDARACDYCGEMYQPKTKASRFCEAKCRVAFHKADKAGRPIPAQVAPPLLDKPKRTDIADRLEKELVKLGVDHLYQASVVLRLAEQLDGGGSVGPAFVSLSKELDRQVDALRLKADLPDDPVRLIVAAVQEKQTHLHAV